jgi:hypothetical protein
MSDYRRLIAIGFGLMLVGVILPYLMVMKLVESTFLLNFLAYGCQVAGLLLGMVGAITLFGAKRKRK